jgi:hypothetical protein
MKFQTPIPNASRNHQHQVDLLVEYYSSLNSKFLFLTWGLIISVNFCALNMESIPTCELDSPDTHKDRPYILLGISSVSTARAKWFEPRRYYKKIVVIHLYNAISPADEGLPRCTGGGAPGQGWGCGVGVWANLQKGTGSVD